MKVISEILYSLNPLMSGLFKLNDGFCVFVGVDVNGDIFLYGGVSYLFSVLNDKGLKVFWPIRLR